MLHYSINRGSAMKKNHKQNQTFSFFLNLRKHLVEVVRHTICYLKTKKHWSSRNPLGWAKIIRIHDQVSVSKQLNNLSVEFPFYFLVQKWVFPWQLQCSFLSRFNTFPIEEFWEFSQDCVPCLLNNLDPFFILVQ